MANEPTNQDIATLVTRQHGEVQTRLSEIEQLQDQAASANESRFHQLEGRMDAFERQMRTQQNEHHRLEQRTLSREEIVDLIEASMAGVGARVLEALSSQEYKDGRDRAIKDTIQAELAGYYTTVQTLKTIKAAVIWLLPLLTVLNILIGLATK